MADLPDPAVTPREAVKQRIEDVKAASDLFTPSCVLPVAINFGDADPYELSQEVTYTNGSVRVVLEQGFKWDGASIPAWLPVVPWIATLLAMHLFPSPWLLVVTALLVLYTIRLLPYMQKMGIHARAACVHDQLYRAQKDARVVCDAIMESIMETDRVPIDVRWLIHRRVRHWGWIAWNKNRRALRAKVAAAQQVEVNPSSAVAPDKRE
jgi:hypothetical protein